MTLAADLSQLESTGLIQLAVAQPEIEYLFRHALLQDTAYDTLVRTERQRLHRAAGQALEGLYPDRLDEMAGVLAHHFAEAGDRQQAAEYSRRAAKRAVETYAYGEALRHLQLALDLTQDDRLAELRLAVLEDLADLYRLVRDGSQAIPLYQQALDLHERLGQADRMADVRLNRKIIETLAQMKWTVEVEQFRQASQARLASREGVTAGLRLLEDEPPHTETVGLYVALSTDAWRNQYPPDWEAAQHFAEQAIETAEALGEPEPLSRALGGLCDALDGRGQLRRQWQVAQRRLRVVQGAGCDVRERLEAMRAAGLARMYVGEYVEALEVLQEAETLARHIQSVGQEYNALSLQSQCFFRLDRWDEVLATEAKWRALAAEHSLERIGPTCFTGALCACVHALRGDLEQAQQLQAESHQVMLTISVDRWGRNQHL
jgi:tetratricopeptide (TPR) repeat protein